VSGIGVVEIVLLVVLLPLVGGTVYVLIEEGARDRRDARWLSRRR
jgi:hypothetical protein